MFYGFLDYFLRRAIFFINSIILAPILCYYSYICFNEYLYMVDYMIFIQNTKKN